MGFQQVFGSDINVIEDIRAAKRDIGTPSEIVTESSFKLGDRARQIDVLMKSDVIPVAFVDASGNVWVLTAGGSGLVMFESADGKPVDDNQSEVIDSVVSSLKKHFGLKAKKPKKTEEVAEPEVTEPDVVLGTAFPTDWPDTMSDVDL